MALGAVWGPPFFLGTAAQFAANEERVRLVDEASALISSTGVVWFAPELERIRGELARERGDFEAAELCFRRSLVEARRQGSPHWELRTALSVVDLWSDAGRREDGLALLAPIYVRLEGSGETNDVRKAAALLQQL